MQRLIDVLFYRHHFWYRVKFTELSELYISLMLRTLGTSLMGIFVPIYFYEVGFTLSEIGLFFAFVYGLRIILDPLTGLLVNRYGPKHILRLSYLFEVISLLAIIGVGNGYLPFWFSAVLMSISLSLFHVSFHVDFSTIQSVKRVGRQLSKLTIFHKLGAALGPLAGGLIATIYGFEITILVSLAIITIASFPLMATGEPVRSRQYKYKFKLDHYHNLRPLISMMIGRGADLMVYMLFWPMFLAIIIFADQAYSGVGLIVAIGLTTAIFSAYLFGKIVDNRRGEIVYRYSIGIIALMHIVRPLINNPQSAIAVSTGSEAINPGFEIPFMKSYYGEADRHVDGRVAFVIGSLAISHLIRVALILIMVGLTTIYSTAIALSLCMVICGLLSLFMLSNKLLAGK